MHSENFAGKTEGSNSPFHHPRIRSGNIFSSGGARKFYLECIVQGFWLTKVPSGGPWES